MGPSLIQKRPSKILTCSWKLVNLLDPIEMLVLWNVQILRKRQCSHTTSALHSNAGFIYPEWDLTRINSGMKELVY